MGFIYYVSFSVFEQFNGTSRKPRLSVFCSDKQLYAMLVDDQNKKCLFYGCTLQKSIRGDPPCNNIVSIIASGLRNFSHENMGVYTLFGA